MAFKQSFPENQTPAMPYRGAAFITGVSSGIGRALALQFLQTGYLVVGTVRQPADGDFLKKAGGLPMLLDVTDGRRLPSVVRRVQRLLGNLPLKFLINNAGTSVCAAWEHMRLDEVRAQLDVNFFGTVSVTQAFLPLIKAGQGRIVLLSSTAFKLTAPFMGAYCASKFAVEAFALTLRQELYGDRIPVICLEPGPVQTRIFEGTRARLRRHHPRAVAQGAYTRFWELSHAMERGGLTPEAAAGKMLRILLKPRPPLRAVVSKSPWFDALMPRIPQRWRDYFVYRLMQPIKKKTDRRANA